jgi:hypothetical protein
MNKITGNHLLIISFIAAGTILALNDCYLSALACAVAAVSIEFN